MNNAFRVPLRAQGGMPEYRSQTIGPEAGANVSARYDDRAAGIVLAQASRNAQADANGWKQFNEGLQAFLHSGNKLYNEYRDKTSKAYIQESLLRAREEMEAWRTEYDKTHKGQSGLQAAADYQQQWAKISEAHMKGLREQGVSGPYEQLAGLHLRENGLHYNSQGVQFQQQQDKAWNTSIYEGQKDEMVRAVQNDPDNAAWHGFLKSGVLDAYRRLHPGEDTSKLEHELDNLIATNRMDVRIAAKDFEGAQRDLAVFSGGGRLSGVPSYTGQARVLAKHESGTQGSMHVSYGLPRTDGVDVGKYSFITKGGNGGSVGEFIRWAGTNGGELGKQLHDKMQALTGGDWNALDSKEFWKSKGGQAAWRELVKSNPEAFERLEDGFWLPRLDKQIARLRPEVQQAIQADKTGALREMALSTINQHRTALKILNDNFDADPETYIRNVYQDRSAPSRFAATGDPNIGVRRMREEVQDVLGILRQEGTPGGMGQSPLTPQQRVAYSKAIETGQKKQAVDDFLSGTMDMPAPERLAQLDRLYGNDPDKREMYDAIRQGIMHDANAKESMRNIERRDRKLASLKEMEQAANLPPEQSYQKMQEIGRRLPLEERADFYKAANNLRNPGYYDDPWAVQEITDRLANGEEVNIRAEYGSRLTPKTAKRFAEQAFRTALPAIKTAFDDVANEWLATEKNKNHAKELGMANKTALWTRFLAQTDADEKKDYARLRQEAADFFKKVTLERGWFGREVETVQGLVGAVLKTYGDARPMQGTPLYGEVTSKLKEMGITPEWSSGAYSAKQLSAGLAALQAENGQRKRGEE